MSAPDLADLADRIEAAIIVKHWLRGMGRARRAVSEIAAAVANERIRELEAEVERLRAERAIA